MAERDRSWEQDDDMDARALVRLLGQEGQTYHGMETTPPTNPYPPDVRPPDTPPTDPFPPDVRPPEDVPPTNPLPPDIRPPEETPPTNPLPPDVGPDVPAPAPKPLAPSVFQGFTPRYSMEGFDFNREQNTGKSAKDAFAFLANQAPPPPLNDKAALGQWFNQYIAPGMNALGHKVSTDGLSGDMFRLKNWQGDFNVDFGRGAGADGGALAWQVQDGATPTPNATYRPAVTKEPPKGGIGTGGGIGLPNQGENPLDAILREIEALTSGSSSPMDQEALLRLLQV